MVFIPSSQNILDFCIIFFLLLSAAIEALEVHLASPIRYFKNVVSLSLEAKTADANCAIITASIQLTNHKTPYSGYMQ